MFPADLPPSPEFIYYPLRTCGSGWLPPPARPSTPFWLLSSRSASPPEFPEVTTVMHVPDEKTRPVGQAVAAANLPKLSK